MWSRSKAERPRIPAANFFTKGFSGRHFRRQFSLVDYVQVKSAGFDNRLLTIELLREIPEAMKPRRIAITGAPVFTRAFRFTPTMATISYAVRHGLGASSD
jgi:Hsp20/alpha crystallin family